MNIYSINFNTSVQKPYTARIKDSCSTGNLRSNPYMLTPPLGCDVVSFSGVANGGDILKKLAVYGVYDMYNGLKLLPPRDLERLQRNKVFSEPLEKMIKTVLHYENSMYPIERQFFGLLKETAVTHPDITMEDAMKMFLPIHKKKLLQVQQPIFESIIQYACDFPADLFEEFSELMNITTKRLVNDPVVLPFSEKEFKYKLKRIYDAMKSKNNKKELSAMNKLISCAGKLFKEDSNGYIFRGKYHRHIQRKLEYQMLPQNLKKNSERLQILRQFLETPALRNNPDLIKLFDITSAKIHGFPAYAQFERKSFIHDLKKITKRLDDKELAEKINRKASSLPTSKENLSAFIVKYGEESNNKIGYCMLMNSLCSVDHLLAKDNGGLSKLFNYGLCGLGINSQKTNQYFDKWVIEHPETAQNCQKYIDRLIELYKTGVFEKVSRDKKKCIDKSYIEDFAKTIYNLSPATKKISLDISKLYE